MNTLSSLLNFIGTRIETSTASATAGGSPSSASCRCIKVGNTVHISGHYRKASDISSNDVLFTVPSGYRPSSTVQLSGILAGSNGAATAYYCNVYSDGKIMQTAGNTIREIHFTGSYTV